MSKVHALSLRGCRRDGKHINQSKHNTVGGTTVRTSSSTRARISDGRNISRKKNFTDFWATTWSRLLHIITTPELTHRTCDSYMPQAPAKVDTNLTEWEAHDVEQRILLVMHAPFGHTPTTNKLQPTCFPKKADENLKQDKHKTTEGMGGIAPPHAAFQTNKCTNDQTNKRTNKRTNEQTNERTHQSFVTLLIEIHDVFQVDYESSFYEGMEVF